MFLHEKFEARQSRLCSYGESRDHQDTTGGGSHDAKGGRGAGARSGSQGGSQASRNAMNLSNIGVGPTGVSAAKSPTSSTGKLESSGGRVFSTGPSVAAPPPNTLPADVVQTLPPGATMQQYSPSYPLSATDRMLEAARFALGIATGGVLTGLGGLAATEMGLFGGKPLTPSRGYVKDASKGISSTARGDKPSPIVQMFTAPVIPQAPKTDTFFAFFNPNT